MIVLLILASVAAPGSGELFTSMTHLQRALNTEQDIAKEIRHYIYEEKERLQKLEQLADKFDNHTAETLKDPELYITNPVNAYLFVKHFTLDLDNNINVVIKNNSRNELHTKIEKMRGHLPTHEDLTGSVSALLRLQDTYKLEVTELARGNVAGFASPELSARDCFEIGRLAFQASDHYHAIIWMEEAHALVQKDGDEDVNSVSILDHLAFSQYKQGNVRRALTLTNEILTLAPEHNKARYNKEYYKNYLREKDDNSTRGDDGLVINKRPLEGYRRLEEFGAYEALCRNENVKANKYQHKLFCRYKTSNHPLLILSPAKEEVLYLNPFISVFHDSISDREINAIQDLAIPRLRIAGVMDSKSDGAMISEYRISKSSWLKDYDSPDIAKISKRVAATTGLSMETAEELQMAYYGIGGQNEPHFDFAKKEDLAVRNGEKLGNRIATFMFYLSDVQAGGATVFPFLGVKVFPEKGKAVFWYNLYKNGKGIFETLHAGCPVLMGSKWVANKWIHERGQEFCRPCGLQESE